jgi:hypothetical protein
MAKPGVEAAAFQATGLQPNEDWQLFAGAHMETGEGLQTGRRAVTELAAEYEVR